MKKMIAMAAAALLAGTAHAHVTFEQRSAMAGSYQKLTLRVGHGCSGSATRELSVQLPEGFGSARPMPKAGWQIKIAANSITWSGGPLPDEYYDEFVLFAKLPAQAGTQNFKITQACVSGSATWDAALELTPAAAAAPHH